MNKFLIILMLIGLILIAGCSRNDFYVNYYNYETKQYENRISDYFCKDNNSITLSDGSQVHLDCSSIRQRLKETPIKNFTIANGEITIERLH